MCTRCLLDAGTELAAVGTMVADRAHLCSQAVYLLGQRVSILAVHGNYWESLAPLVEQKRDSLLVLVRVTNCPYLSGMQGFPRMRGF